jgi:hypothetical protein
MKITERIDRITLLTDEYRSAAPADIDRRFFERILRERRAAGGTACEKCIARAR